MTRRHTVWAAIVVATLFGVVFLRENTDDQVLDTGSEVSAEERERVRAFWTAQRAATEHRIQGRIVEAAAAYADALSIDSTHEDALYYGGAMQLRLDSAARAEHLWRRLVTVNPVSARAHHQLGELYLCPDYPETFNLEQAHREFRRALEINREETGPLFQLAKVALARAQWDSAASLLDRLLNSNPSSERALFYRGFVAWRTGDSDQSLDDFRAAAELLQAPTEAPTGLTEGETEGGRAMVVERTRCRQFEQPMDGMAEAEADRGTMERRYELVARVLEQFRAP